MVSSREIVMTLSDRRTLHKTVNRVDSVGQALLTSWSVSRGEILRDITVLYYSKSDKCLVKALVSCLSVANIDA